MFYSADCEKLRHKSRLFQLNRHTRSYIHIIPWITWLKICFPWMLPILFVVVKLNHVIVCEKKNNIVCLNINNIYFFFTIKVVFFVAKGHIDFTKNWRLTQNLELCAFTNWLTTDRSSQSKKNTIASVKFKY